MDPEEHAMLVRTVGEAFPVVRSYMTFISSFMYLWGFLTASDTVDPSALPFRWGWPPRLERRDAGSRP